MTLIHFYLPEQIICFLCNCLVNVKVTKIVKERETTGYFSLLSMKCLVQKWISRDCWVYKEWSNRKVRIPLFDSQVTCQQSLLVRACIKTMHAKRTQIYLNMTLQHSNFPLVCMAESIVVFQIHSDLLCQPKQIPQCRRTKWDQYKHMFLMIMKQKLNQRLQNYWRIWRILAKHFLTIDQTRIFCWRFIHFTKVFVVVGL